MSVLSLAIKPVQSLMKWHRIDPTKARASIDAYFDYYFNVLSVFIGIALLIGIGR